MECFLKLSRCVPSIVVEPTEGGEVESGELRWPPDDGSGDITEGHAQVTGEVSMVRVGTRAGATSSLLMSTCRCTCGGGGARAAANGWILTHLLTDIHSQPVSEERAESAHTGRDCDCVGVSWFD